MALIDQLFPNVHSALETISKQENFTDFVITYCDKIEKGQGFMGDVFFLNIQDKNSNKKLELVVKQSTDSEYVRNNIPIHILYNNESNFYEKIWPTFIDFQKENLKTLIFNNLPKCYATDLKPGNEFLILENLNKNNFSNIDKNHFFNREQAEYILIKFGQFHGLSFAYKNKYPKEFSALSQVLIPYWMILSNIDLFQSLMKKGFTECLRYLDPSTDLNIIEKIKGYVENGVAIFQNSVTYNGNNGVILQGDCWSNNIFLKYNNIGKLEDMKMIDFQISNVGSVVHDLSYCLYAGGSKEIFDNFNHYLKIYHESLSDTCLKFSCPNFISLDELKEEWKNYGRCGFILGIILIDIKLSENVSLDDMAKMNDEGVQNFSQDDAQTIKRKLLELVNHMFENDFL
ncbi:uncharacterized protein LOC130899708 [Diorhabda carinulata]|uniref:uncharacterized protein LOC130899708 n=1 Tax=Diorhabda carinulata TaxID=1163345 RepID=UPI0025A22EAE|nr:uncharacterized protein LOC130899708 [Diorhabda carinulata]